MLMYFERDEFSQVCLERKEIFLASFCEDSSLLIDRSLHGTTLNVSDLYIPVSTIEQNMVCFFD